MRPVSMAMVLVALAAAAGCGDDNDTRSSEPSEVTYAELLIGLKKAALADTGYKGARRANALPPPEKATVDAFCEVTWKLKVNRELDALTDPEALGIVPRVRAFAETKLVAPSVTGEERAISAAMAKLDSIVDLASLDVDLNNRYKRACYT